MKENIYKCQLCESTSYKEIQKYSFKNKIFENKSIVKCIKCSFKSIHPIPETSQLEAYNQKYFLNAHGDLKYNKITEVYFNTIAKCRVNFLQKFLEKKKIENILEIGPGKGHFYQNFIKINKDIDYNILDADASIQNLFKKKKIKSFNCIDSIKENQYDLIVMSHVLEHEANPNEFLSKIKKNLRQDGTLFFEVPCLDYIYKDLIEPHIFFYDKKSISTLLSNNNLKNYQIFYFGKKIKDMKNKELNKQFKFRLIHYLLKLNLTFLIKINNSDEYNFLKNKYEKVIANLYGMNSEHKEASWWMRVVVKNS